ncbi:hypothetical protein HK101_003598, partial [Irineochytrium annulatum]
TPTAQQSTACAGLFTEKSAYPASKILACYNSFPATSQNVTAFVKSLAYYLPLSTNLDLVKSQAGIDLAGKLNAIGTDATITNEFQLHSKIYSLMYSIPEYMGYGYATDCFEGWEFYQPWTYDVIVDSTGPVLYLGTAETTLNTVYPQLASSFRTALGYDPTKYVGYTVTTINGQDALSALVALNNRLGSSNTTVFNALQTDPVAEWLGATFQVGPASQTRQVYDAYYQSAVTYVVKGAAGETATLVVPWQAVFTSADTTLSAYMTANCVATDPRTTIAAVAKRRRDVQEKPILSRRKVNLPGAASSPIARRSLPIATYTDIYQNAFYMINSNTGVWQAEVSDTFAATQDATTWAALFDSIDQGLRKLSNAGAENLIIDVSSYGLNWQACGGYMISKYFFGSSAVKLEYDIMLPTTFLQSYKNWTGAPGLAFYGQSKRYAFGTKGYQPTDGSASILTNPATVRSATRSSRFNIQCDTIASIDALIPPFIPSKIVLLSTGACIGACAEFAYNAQQQKASIYVYGADPSLGTGSAQLASFPASFFFPAQLIAVKNYWPSIYSNDTATMAPFQPFPGYFDIPVMSAYLPGTPVADASLPLEFMSGSLIKPATYLPVKNMSDVGDVYLSAAKNFAGSPSTFADQVPKGTGTGSGGTGGGTGSGSGLSGGGSSSDSGSGTNLGLIVGIAVGAVVLIVIAVVVIVLVQRQKRLKNAAATTNVYPGGVQPAYASGVPQSPYAPAVVQPYGNPAYAPYPQQPLQQQQQPFAPAPTLFTQPEYAAEPKPVYSSDAPLPQTPQQYVTQQNPYLSGAPSVVSGSATASNPRDSFYSAPPGPAAGYYAAPPSSGTAAGSSMGMPAEEKPPAFSSMAGGQPYVFPDRKG